MNDLENQLRLLGEAAQADVSPVAASDIVGGPDLASATDIGVQDATRRHAPTRKPLRRSSLVVAAAAVLVIVVVGGVIAFNSSPMEPAVDLASQTQPTFYAPPDDNGWTRLRFCESTGLYDTDTGNTFYGAYQLTHSNFDDGAQSLGFDAFVGTNPAQASPPIQDAVANALFLEEGADAWPICGRYLSGPMITPIVPHWLDASDENDLVLVFVEPGISEDLVAAVAAEIDTILIQDPAASYEFFDQAQSFAEFLTMVFDDETTRPALAASDMPARFNVTTALPADALQVLREIDGVFEVVHPIEELFDHPRGPLRISIPAIGLNAPVRLSPTVENFDRGLVAMVNQPDVLAVGGFASFPGSAFERLNDLRDNDTVIVSTLVINELGPYEIVQTFNISIDTASGEPDIREVTDLLLWRRPHAQRLVLVADVAGQPDQRVIVRADSVEAPSGYATSDG